MIADIVRRVKYELGTLLYMLIVQRIVALYYGALTFAPKSDTMRAKMTISTKVSTVSTKVSTVSTKVSTVSMRVSTVSMRVSTVSMKVSTMSTKIISQYFTTPTRYTILSI